MTLFTRWIGIDYSGAETPEMSLPGLRIYLAQGQGAPVEVPPPPSLRKYWTRRGIAEWLIVRLSEEMPTLVGINHGFSFPLRYFEAHRLAPDWPAFLDDFQRHWPTDDPHCYVDFVREGLMGNAAARSGRPDWLRLTEVCSGTQAGNRSVVKSVFHFDNVGSVARATHAGLPWLRQIRLQVGARVHVWPFDGFDIPPGRSVVAEMHPVLFSREFPRDGRDRDQHDAWCIAAWLARADRDGTLASLLETDLTAPERTLAGVEGWILGVAGAARTAFLATLAPPTSSLH